MQPRARAKDPSASSFVHEESSYLAKVAQAEAFKRKINTTLDGTGDSSEEAVRKKIDAARAAGYTVAAYYVSVPTEIAVERAKDRAINGTGSDRGRAVPPSVIEHAHAAVSQILPHVADEFDSLVLFDTNVPFGTPPNLMARKDPDGDFTVMNQDLYDAFLGKAGDNGPVKDKPLAAPDTGSAEPVKPAEPDPNAPKVPAAGGGGDLSPEEADAKMAEDDAAVAAAIADRTPPTSLSTEQIEAAIAAIEDRNASEDGDEEYLQLLKDTLQER
jgi:predicted ABC-type ATPase